MTLQQDPSELGAAGERQSVAVEPSHYSLGELIEALEAADPALTVPIGFGRPHSWRGDYSELAFDPAADTTVADMLAAARSAVGATYEGWKGGDFTMSLHTSVYLAEPRELGETLGQLLLSLMLANGRTS